MLLPFKAFHLVKLNLAELIKIFCFMYLLWLKFQVSVNLPSFLLILLLPENVYWDQISFPALNFRKYLSIILLTWLHFSIRPEFSISLASPWSLCVCIKHLTVPHAIYLNWRFIVCSLLGNERSWNIFVIVPQSEGMVSIYLFIYIKSSLLLLLLLCNTFNGTILQLSH